MTTQPAFDWSDPIVVKFLERVKAAQIQKIKPDHCAQSKTLHAIANRYVETYTGDFAYLRDMQSALVRWQALTDGQAAGVLNCLLREYHQRATFTMPQATLPDLSRRCSLCGSLLETGAGVETDAGWICADRNACENRRAIDPTLWRDTRPIVNTPVASQEAHRATEAPSPVVDEGGAALALQRVCPNGTYTIVLNEQGDYRTLRLVDAPESFNKPVGTQIAQYLSGSDNEHNYTGFAFVIGKTAYIWNKYKVSVAQGNNRKHVSQLASALETLLQADRDQQADYGQAYAIESGNCWACGRKLTVPASLARGLGPICAEKLGF